MRYVLIALSLCILGHNAPALANAGVVYDGRELSDNAILRILLKDSKIQRPNNINKVVAYSLKLTNKHKITGKEKAEIIEFLLPNRDEVRRWTSHDGNLRERFWVIYKLCLADVLWGHRDIGNHWAVAGRVADILIP